jgi:uncharacterized protein
VATTKEPRLVIGSVNAAEFFVTVAQAATFFTMLGFHNFKLVVALILGGIIAAPIAAYTCSKIPKKPLMIMVGILIIGLSVRTILSSMPR